MSEAKRRLTESLIDPSYKDVWSSNPWLESDIRTVLAEMNRGLYCMACGQGITDGPIVCYDCDCFDSRVVNMTEALERQKGRMDAWAVEIARMREVISRQKHILKVKNNDHE